MSTGLFVIQNKETKYYRAGTGKFDEWNVDLNSAHIFKRRVTIEAAWWFDAEKYEILDVKLELA